ncbi:MAG: hypothetical protein JO051_13670 [Acidobacteriaceae bacterium]|nr:hypothetical protein [Acidobacteriaceae bacterium]
MATLSAPRATFAPQVDAVSHKASAHVSWYIWCATLAATSLMIGAHWDISWHSSIGRDTFWTPAHMAIYACGVLSGVAFGYLILHTTFSRSSPLAAGSVHIWGFRAPLGAFIASWGGIAMLTSAPFDNWWHAAYGLDVKIVSPPHILLFIGGYGVLVGTMALIAGHMNREAESRRGAYARLFLYLCGVMFVLTMVVVMEYTERPALHSTLPYVVLCAVTPVILTVGSRATGLRFATTYVAAFYTCFLIGLILVLPLFPAEPKLGPVYQHVTHFIPPQFPLLIIVPAFLLDLFGSKTRNLHPWANAILSAAIYLVGLVAAEWPFATFLMSPAARNRFFGTMYLWYGAPPLSFTARDTFFPSQHALQLALGFGLAFLFATVMFRSGASRGNWFRSIQR